MPETKAAALAPHHARALYLINRRHDRAARNVRSNGGSLNERDRARDAPTRRTGRPNCPASRSAISSANVSSCACKAETTPSSSGLTKLVAAPRPLTSTREAGPTTPLASAVSLSRAAPRAAPARPRSPSSWRRVAAVAHRQSSRSARPAASGQKAFLLLQVRSGDNADPGSALAAPAAWRRPARTARQPGRLREDRSDVVEQDVLNVAALGERRDIAPAQEAPVALQPAGRGAQFPPQSQPANPSARTRAACSTTPPQPQRALERRTPEHTGSTPCAAAVATQAREVWPLPEMRNLA
jgi:hypothetical protein